MRNVEFLRDFGGGIRAAARQRDDLDAGDLLDGLDVLDAEGALAGDADFHDLVLSSGSMHSRPDAVFDVGTR